MVTCKEVAVRNASLGVDCSDRGPVVEVTFPVEQLECVRKAEWARVTTCPSLQAVTKEWSPLLCETREAAKSTQNQL